MTVLQTTFADQPIGSTHSFGGSATSTTELFFARVNESSIPATWQRNERVLMFLEKLYDFCQFHEEQQALRALLGRLELLLRTGDAQEVDAILKLVDVARLAPSVLLAALSITAHGSDALRERAAFLERAASELGKQLGEARAQNLLASRR